MGLLTAARDQLFKRSKEQATGWAKLVTSYSSGKKKGPPSLEQIEAAGEVFNLKGQQAIHAFEQDIAGVTEVMERESAIAAMEKQYAQLNPESAARKVESLTAELSEAKRHLHRAQALQYRLGMAVGSLDRLKLESAPRVYGEIPAPSPEPTPVQTIEDIPIGGAAFITE